MRAQVKHEVYVDIYGLVFWEPDGTDYVVFSLGAAQKAGTVPANETKCCWVQVCDSSQCSVSMAWR